MQTKKEILELLDKGQLTVEEALQMLKHADAEAQPTIKPEEIKEPIKKTFDEMIDDLTQDVCKDMEMETILDFMEKKKWEYIGKPVDLESVTNNIRYLIKEAVSICVTRYKKDNDEDAQGILETGGFKATAYINEDHQIEVDVQFIGDSGFSEISLDDMLGVCPENHRAFV
jgi:polyhydroxyalkanoate synthesis regulator phasin